MDLEKLLYLLSDGEFHSGSELGIALGVSRTSIWKSLPLLEKLSVTTEVVKGKGYRIPGGLDLLDKLKITSSLLPIKSFPDVSIDILLSHESTNDYLINLFKAEGASNYKLCLAEKQLAGKGRRGRSWVSPFAKNIYLSLGFPLEVGVEKLSGLSLVIGIAVAETLSSLGVSDVGLKWPNDVYVQGKKVAGILVELSGEATTSWNVVCGIGLNVAMTKEEGESINQDWVALNRYVACNRSDIVVALTKQLINIIEEFKVVSFAKFVARWKSYDILLGEDVVVSATNICGEVLGVNAQGALLVDDGNINVINAGEISVKRL